MTFNLAYIGAHMSNILSRTLTQISRAIGSQFKLPPTIDKDNFDSGKIEHSRIMTSHDVMPTEKRYVKQNHFRR